MVSFKAIKSQHNIISEWLNKKSVDITNLDTVDLQLNVEICENPDCEIKSCNRKHPNLANGVSEIESLFKKRDDLENKIKYFTRNLQI